MDRAVESRKIHISIVGYMTTLDCVFGIDHDGRYYWLTATRSGKRRRFRIVCGRNYASYQQSTMRRVYERNIPAPVLEAFKKWEAERRVRSSPKPKA